MKALKVFAFCIIFPFVMYFFTLLGAQSAPLQMNPESFAWSLVINVSVPAILGVVSGVILSWIANIDLLRLFMFESFMIIVGALCLSTVDNFATLGGQHDMSIGIFLMIKILVSLIVLIAGYTILVGGDWEVD